jgi:uncharacterized protein
VATLLRVVVDTSSLIRAALNAGSAAGALLNELTSQGSNNQLVTSSEILDELATVISRPKFGSRLTLQQRRRFLLQMQATAFFVSPVERIDACRDPADNMVLEAALAAAGLSDHPVVIVSDDRDLLTLDPWQGITIGKPEAVLAMLIEDRASDHREGSP